MSNRYWGWGLEDDEFYVRMRRQMLEVSTCTDLSLVMKCISSYFIGVKNSYKLSLCFLVSCQKELIGEFDNFTIVHDPLKFFFLQYLL